MGEGSDGLVHWWSKAPHGPWRRCVRGDYANTDSSETAPTTTEDPVTCFQCMEDHRYDHRTVDWKWVRSRDE